MSLILDALRKSEAERRRGNSPDLFASLPTPAPTQRPGLLRLWPWFAIAAVVVGAASVFLLSRDAGVPAVAESQQPVVADDRSDAIAAPVASSAPPPAASAQAAPAQAIAPPAASTGQQAQRASAAEMPATAPPEPTTSDAATPAASPATESKDEPLPPIAILTASERASLPPLKLSMHVWNSEPTKRFAIIDGQRIAEGAVLGSGVIEQIRRDGVVLDLDGRRILLPRP
jgi:general secretion pathway protein B